MAKNFVQPAKNIQTNCDNLGTLIIKLPLFGLWSKRFPLSSGYIEKVSCLLTYFSHAMCNEQRGTRVEVGVHLHPQRSLPLINQYKLNRQAQLSNFRMLFRKN